MRDPQRFASSEINLRAGKGDCGTHEHHARQDVVSEEGFAHADPEQEGWLRVLQPNVAFSCDQEAWEV